MENVFIDLLKERKSAIAEKWFKAIMVSYPIDSSGFLINQKDRFANPIGHTFSNGVESIIESLIEGGNFDEGKQFLEDIIKVRAIQDFTAAKALNFIFALKKIVREELEKEIRQNQITSPLLGFESKIDDLALFAFDIYVKFREQLYQLKTDELKRMTFTMLKKANLMSEIPVQESEHKDQQ